MRIHLMRDFMKVFNYMYFKRIGESKIPNLELGGYVVLTRKSPRRTQKKKNNNNNITGTGTPDGNDHCYIPNVRYSRRWDSMCIR